MAHWPTSGNWRRRPWLQLAAAVLGAGPIYALAIAGGWQSVHSGDFAVPGPLDSLYNALLTSALFGSWIMLVQLLVCGELPRQLQLRPFDWRWDVLDGVSLTMLLFLTQFLLGFLLSDSPLGGVPEANVQIGRALAGNPWLLAVWLGPVIWLQAALLEEYTRAFVLVRLWQAWPQRWLQTGSVVLTALVFGLGHLYQGAAGVLGTFLIGLVLGAYYLASGRFLPLVVGHGLYNTGVLIALTVMAQQGSLD